MNNQTQEILGFLHRIYIFASLPPEDLSKIIPYLKIIFFSKGSFIYKSGDQADGLYLIKSGIVAVHSKTEDESANLYYLGRGNYLGETALLGEQERKNTVQAVTYLEALFFKKEDFWKLLQNHPSLTLNSFLSLGQRILQIPPKYPQKPPAEVIVVYPHLEKEAQVFFTVHLSLSLIEQTRQKTILIDCTSEAGKTAQCLNLSPILSTEQMFGVEDLYSREILQKIINHHSSGLDLISFSPDLFRGKLLPALSPFLSLLRDYYYRTIFCLPVEPNPTAKLILESADKILFAFAPDLVLDGYSALEKYKQLFQTSPSLNSKIRTILWTDDTAKLNLAEQEEQFSRKIDFVFSHRKNIIGIFSQNGLFGQNNLTNSFRKNISRLSRYLSKLQVGLALGSGIAYGYTAIGILRVLESENIPIDLIGGTSIGALIGSFYAAGKTTAELEEIAKSITKRWLLRNFLFDLNLSRSGLFVGQKILKFLYSILGDIEFSQLTLPFFCVATDISSGEATVLNKGKVYQAVRGSISMPGFFKPYCHQGHCFVDGGLVEPVPVKEIREAGADIVLSLNLISQPISQKKFLLLKNLPNRMREEVPNILEIILKSIYIMEYEICNTKAEKGDIIFAPDISGYGSLELHRAPELIKIGEETAQAKVEEIKKLLPYFKT